jgi:hypothetical protein
MNEQKNESVVIRKKLVYQLIGGIAVTVAIAFLTGYHIGAAVTLHTYMADLDQEAFSDSVYASLCAQYEENDEEQKNDSVDSNLSA